MRRPPGHHDAEAVGAGHDRAAAITHLANVELRPQVQPEHRFGFHLREEAFLEHQRRAAALAVRRAFLRRLEHEHHRARQLLAHRGEHRGRTHQDRRVTVVTAGVRDADRLAAKLGCRNGLERQVRLLGYRQRIHVRAQRDDRPRTAAAKDSDDAGVRDPGSHFETEQLQVRGHQARRAHLAVAQLGVAVDVAAPFDDLWPDALDGGFERRRRLRGVRRSRERGQQAGGSNSMHGRWVRWRRAAEHSRYTAGHSCLDGNDDAQAADSCGVPRTALRSPASVS